MAGTAPRRGRLARPLYLLAALLVAVYIAVTIGVAVQGEDGNASFTPKLALDLEGGTQLILTPRTDDGSAVTSDDIDQAISIIRQRVDGSGVAEAEITSQGGRNIVVAIPGQVDDDTVDLISASAQMRMRTVLYESGPGAIDPSQLLPDTAQDATATDPADDADHDENAANDEQAAEDAAAEEAAAEAKDPREEATPSSIATPQVYTQDEIDAAAKLAADQDGDGVLSSTPDTEPTSPSDTAWITEQVMYEYYRLDCSLPENRVGGQDDDTAAPLVACSDTGDAKYILGPAELTGQDLKSASMAYQRTSTGVSTNVPIVQMFFTSSGGDIFADVTTRLSQNSAPLNQFAIVLDGLVISAPRVSTPIPNGEATIEGPSTNPFTRSQALTLANQLNFGSLPLTFEVQSQEQISATLGTEQLERGMLAGIIGLILVVGYGFLQYRGLGIVTVASLVIAAALVYGTLLLLSWTQGYRLSLPGVVGLIIAIGITADSFIVYFERIRDEVREGRTLSAAVDYGWVRARRTILASDAVNFIAAIVLYILAVGGVRGFAFTLGLTTLIDLVVVFLFTHPLMRLLIKTKFFGGGHRLSGLDPEHLGASVATYAGRGRVRSGPEKATMVAGADTRTVAQRKADAARAAREEAARELAEAELAQEDAEMASILAEGSDEATAARGDDPGLPGGSDGPGPRNEEEGR